MSEKSGIPVSTLSKVEHDRLTLTYDKLYQVSQRLGMRMSELFAETEPSAAPAITARRSLGDIDQAVRVETPNYDYYYLCTELRRKRMIPVITKIRAKTSRSSASWSTMPARNSSTSSAARSSSTPNSTIPSCLAPGQSIYIDSSMGHAYLAAEGCDEAEVLGVMSSGDEELQQSLMSIHDAHGGHRNGGRRGRHRAAMIAALLALAAAPAAPRPSARDRGASRAVGRRMDPRRQGSDLPRPLRLVRPPRVRACAA